MPRFRRRSAGALLALAVLASFPAAPVGAEATPPRLRAADDYAVIADQAVTNTGPTAITGNVAIAATANLVGFPPGTIVGETHLADQEALDAAGATAAVNQDLKSQPCNSDRTGENLGGLRLGEAVYCYITTAELDGELRLDALGERDAAWVFQIAGDLNIAAGSRVILANGAQSCNVFWQVSGNVIIGDGVELAGTLVTDGTIVLGEGATVDGRLFAPAGDVQLHDNTVSQSACIASTDQVTTTTSTTSTTAAPETTTTTTATTTLPTPTTTPVSGTGTGTGSGTGRGTGSGTGSGAGDDGGLAATGPVSVTIAVLAASALGLGHALVGTERMARWNRRRWRPRHAESRVERLRRRLRQR